MTNFEKTGCLDCDFSQSSELDPSKDANARATNWHAMHRLEKKLLDLTEDQRPTALCLSGGGVRSAITCLGVIDVLAREKVLERVDYLSTVSGGGYTGMALSNWLNDFWKARAGDEEAQWNEADHDPRIGGPRTCPQEKCLGDLRTEPRFPKDKTQRPLLPPYAVPFVTDPDDPQPKEQQNEEDSWLKARIGGSFDPDRAAIAPPAGAARGDGDADVEPAGSCASKTAADENGDSPGDAQRAAARARINEDNKAYIRHLRANVGYLTPQGVSSVFVGLYVVVRAMLLNLVIWTGLIAGLFLALINIHFGADTVDAPVPTETEPFQFFLSGAGDTVSAIWTLFLDALSESGLFGLSLALSVLLFALVPVAMVAYSFVTYVWAPAGWRTHPSALDAPENAMAQRPEPRRAYSMRRRSDKLMGWVLSTAVLLGLFGAISLVGDNLEAINNFLSTLGLSGAGDAAGSETTDAGGALSSPLVASIATLFGIGTSVFAFIRNRLGQAVGAKTAILVVAGSALFVYGIAVLAFLLARHGLALPVFTVAALLAFFVSINDISLGRYYRDRLIEAFVPDRLDITNGKPLARTLRPSHKGDKLRLHEMRGKTECQRPLHIVNTNLSCPWSTDTRARRRKGDNFIFSAIGTGSDSTGWRPTARVAKGRMTLATAIAASGAAVNPTVGFSGQGPTTQGLVSVAMSILSIRLGYWLRWRDGPLTCLNRFGNHINPPAWHLLRTLVPRKATGGHAKAPRFLELTDGANFDNLGLYEMIRRRARVMIVCDAGADRETSYAAFTSLIRRVREDFGAEIDINMERDLAPRESNVTTMVDTGPQDLVARKAEDQYPRGVEFARKGYFLASVTYGTPPLDPGQDGYRACAAQSGDGEKTERGLIIYMKSALIPSVSITTKGYRGANEHFPFDSTANQFFSAEQFEAYRDMGRAIAREMVRDLHLDGENRVKTVFAPDERTKSSDSTLMENPAFRRKHALE